MVKKLTFTEKYKLHCEPEEVSIRKDSELLSDLIGLLTFLEEHAHYPGDHISTISYAGSYEIYYKALKNGIKLLKNEEK